MSYKDSIPTREVLDWQLFAKRAPAILAALVVAILLVVRFGGR